MEGPDIQISKFLYRYFLSRWFSIFHDNDYIFFFFLSKLYWKLVFEWETNIWQFGFFVVVEGGTPKKALERLSSCYPVDFEWQRDNGRQTSPVTFSYFHSLEYTQPI